MELVLPKTLRKEPLDDNPNRFALMWGPLVLAGDLGKEVEWEERRQGAANAPPPAPVFVAAQRSVENWLRPVSGKPGTFRTSGVGLTTDINFVSFYELLRRRYAIYWDMFTPQEWQKKSEAYAAEQGKKRKLEAATVAFAQPGQMQTERDFNQQGEDTRPVQLEGRFGRQGGKWFSFNLPVDSSHPMVLVVTYSNDGYRKGSVDILADGQKMGTQTNERRSPEQEVRFFDVEYAIPAELLKDKKKVSVRFEASDGNAISGVYGIRMVGGDAER